MLSRGLGATTIDDVCNLAGTTKGAFFYYFGSKAAFAEAVLAFHAQCAAAAYESATFMSAQEPLERLFGYVDLTASLCRDPVAEGCLFGVLTMEQSQASPEIGAICRSAFDGWSKMIQGMLADVEERYELRAPGGISSLADHFIVIFEGALLLARARGDVTPVRDGLEHFKRYLLCLCNERGGLSERTAAQPPTKGTATHGEAKQ